jgi:phosphoglycolate phosphatase-like HAD superfamily hydrolase
MKEAIFLDFDGVIVDSIRECYIISFNSYYDIDDFKYDKQAYEDLFYKYRYLAGPVYQFMSLHNMLEKVINTDLNESESIELFNKIDSEYSLELKKQYEYTFFQNRKLYKKNMKDWLNLHELTEFGKSIQQLEDSTHHYIITTKDKDSVKLLCDYFSICINNIFSKDDYNSIGSKGEIISNFLDRSEYESVVFIDDSVKHLDSVDDSRVKLFFANWAYDVKKNKYKVYDNL